MPRASIAQDSSTALLYFEERSVVLGGGSGMYWIAAQEQKRVTGGNLGSACVRKGDEGREASHSWSLPTWSTIERDPDPGPRSLETGVSGGNCRYAGQTSGSDCWHPL